MRVNPGFYWDNGLDSRVRRFLRKPHGRSGKMSNKEKERVYDKTWVAFERIRQETGRVLRGLTDAHEMIKVYTIVRVVHHLAFMERVEYEGDIRNIFNKKQCESLYDSYERTVDSVSYTHLTLPTIYSV